MKKNLHDKLTDLLREHPGLVVIGGIDDLAQDIEAVVCEHLLCDGLEKEAKRAREA